MAFAAVVIPFLLSTPYPVPNDHRYVLILPPENRKAFFFRDTCHDSILLPPPYYRVPVRFCCILSIQRHEALKLYVVVVLYGSYLSDDEVFLYKNTFFM